MTYYLTEDIEQIKRYFPGAKAVALHTPFDLTERPGRTAPDTFRPDLADPDWPGGALQWTH